MKTSHKCIFCGKEFLAYKSSGQLYCGRKCFSKSRIDIRRSGVIRVCPVCKKEFLTKYPVNSNPNIFCSRECYSHQKITINRICIVCKKPFSKTLYPSKLKENPYTFCSPKCSQIHNPPPHKIGKLSSHWKGGKVITAQGYCAISSPKHPNVNSKGYVPEQNLIAEKILGRFLDKGELIHHINGIRTDNRPENLYLCKTNSEHRKVHWAVKKGEIKELKSNLFV